MSYFALPPYHNRFPATQVGVAIKRLPLQEAGLFREAVLLRHRLPLEPYALMGWSYGGLVAWLHALCYPQSVSSLILIGTIPDLDMAHWHYKLARPVLRIFPWSSINIRRLVSMASDFPAVPPKVPTRWFLGADDPFHDWYQAKLPVWKGVDFHIVSGGQFPDIATAAEK